MSVCLKEDANRRLVGSAVPTWHSKVSFKDSLGTDDLQHVLEGQKDWILMSEKDRNNMGGSKKVSR